MSMKSPLRSYWSRYKDGLVFVLPSAVLLLLMACLWGLPAVARVVSGELTRDLTLEYPVYVDLDEKDNLFVIDRNSRRIVSLSLSGKVRWTAEGGKRSEGFYETYRLASTNDGGAVAYSFIRDAQNDSLEAEEIVRFGPRGEFLGTLVRIAYPADQRGSDDGRIGSLRVRSGSLYYTYSSNGKLELKQRSLEPQTGSADPQSHTTVFTSLVSQDLVVTAEHLPQGILAADRRGILHLFRQDARETVPQFSVRAGVRAIEKPWDLKVGPGGEVYILDNLQTAVYRAASLDAGTVELVLNEKTVLDKGRHRPSFEGLAVSPSGTLAVVDKFNHSVFLRSASGHATVVSGGAVSDGNRAWIAVLFAIDVLGLFLGLWSLVGILRRQFADRTSLIVKQILLFLPLVVVSVSVGSWPIYRLLDESFQKQMRAKLVMVADLGSRLVDGHLVDQIRSASDWDGAAHQALGRQFSSILNANRDAWSQDLRVVIYKFQNDRFYFVKNYSSYYGVMFPYGGAQPEHFASARGGTVESALYSDEYGTYLSGIAPVRSADGHIAGILEVYHNYNSVIENTQLFVTKLLEGILLVVAAVLVLLIGVDILIFLSLGYLRRASRSLMEGELGILVKSSRRDEIGDLARDFNTMSSRLREHFDRLTKIRDANARFVPSAFLEFLEKDGLHAVVSGDQTRRRMTVLFADIRGFTTLSEGMSPKENFDFVNEYFSVMGPVVREHGGFIDRYLGDAILALFPRSPQDAVEAGLSMRRALGDFNAQRAAQGKVAVNFGVGLHVAELLLGVVGEPHRLAVTVVSDAVDLANQLEAATKKYAVGLVMTQAVWDTLPDSLQKSCKALGSEEHAGTTYEVFGL